MKRGGKIGQRGGFYLKDLQIKNLKKVEKKQALQYRKLSEGRLMI